MKKLTAALLCALLAPACLTQGLWDWAADTYPMDAKPVNSGVDEDGRTIILVAVDGAAKPAFSLRVPVDWRERVSVSVGGTGETIHSPLYLSPRPVPRGILDQLAPTEEAWFLSHEPETDSVDVLVESEGGHLVVATAKLPSEAHWERRVTAAILTAPAFVVDAVAFVCTSIFLSWLDLDTWLVDTEDQEDWDDQSEEDDSPVDPPSGLIHPARGPS